MITYYLTNHMTRFLQGTLLLILISICIINNSHAQSFLKVDGQSIVNEEGEAFIFRGMGLGGWMLQEGYMLKTTGFGNAQHELKAKIAELIGEEAKDEFYDAWLSNHVNKNDIDALKSWGFNSVRLPMHYNLYTLPIEDEPIPGENTWLDKGFELTDSLIEWCRANEMYIILDLHAAPGGQGRDAAISDYDPSKPSLWESEENRDKTVALWKKIAERYKDEPIVGAYDLINETNWDMDGNILLRDLSMEITDSIRAVDSKHMIFIEGNWFANDFTNLTPPWDDNMVYSPHKYWSFNDQASIQWVLDIREQYNVPLMLGESGENSNVWFTDAITLLEDNNIGWAWWPMKKVEDIAGPISVAITPGYQQLLDYWNSGGTKPDSAFAKSVLLQLAEDFRLENGTFQKDVIDAMFRQVENDEPAPYTTFEVPGVVYASDFDLGGLNVAYFDVDHANYQVSTGSFTAWNNGWTYRNDGVDIEKSEDNINSNGVNVGWLAADEWMQYDLNITEEAVYDIKVRVAANGSDGAFHFASGTASISPTTSVPNTGGWQTWESILVSNVILSSNDNKLRFYVDTQGFNVGSFELIKKGETTSIATDFLSGITIDDQNIQVNLNKSLDLSTTADLSNFTVLVNGSSVSTTSAMVDENNSRILYFGVDHVFRSSDVIQISYSGNAIKAFDGSTLNTFNLKNIQNTVAIIHQLPGKVEMEDFFFQSGVQLESSADEGGGENIGFLDNGDYLDYYINVPQAGNYQVDFRTAAQSETGAVKLQVIEASGEIITLFTQNFAPTGDWQNWSTTEGPEVSLSAGQHQLRVSITAPLFNMNWMEFKSTTSTYDLETSHKLSLAPNPTRDIVTLRPNYRNAQNVRLSIIDALGSIVKAEKIFVTGNEEIEVDLSGLPQGAYFIVLKAPFSKPLTSSVLKMD